MKFRKKPVVIEAEQYGAGGPTPAGVCTGECRGYRYAGECTPHVHTLEGDMTVSDGDWIITGVKGERYPCKPDIFEATYEPAEEPVHA